MVHFNELYITEDEKNLVIDTEIDDFAVYKGAYIKKITVNTVENYCNGRSDLAIDVYAGADNVLYVDMNNDKKIDDADKFIIDWLNEILNRITIDSKYDVNMDGKVDLGDISAVIQVILEQNKTDSIVQRAHVNDDEEVNIADVQTIIAAILEHREWFENNLTEEICKQIFGYLDEDGNYVKGLLDIWNDKKGLYMAEPTDEHGIWGEGKRHVRKCLDKLDLAAILGKTSISDNIFLVTVTADINGNEAELAELGCGWDNNIIYGIAYNGQPLYSAFLDMADSYGDNCDNTKLSSMADYILNYYAFDFAMRVGDWCAALKHWKFLTGTNTSSGIASGRGCGCHGPH